MAEVGRLKRSASRAAHDAELAVAKKKLSEKRNVASGAGTAYAQRPGTGVKRRD